MSRVNHIVSDTIARLRNALAVRNYNVSVCYSKLCMSMLAVLKSEGYISDFVEVELRPGVRIITVKLKYYSGKPVIQSIKTVSKPGCRRYSGCKEISSYYNGLGISILTTSSGVMSDFEAKKRGVGGEVLCVVF